MHEKPPKQNQPPNPSAEAWAHVADETNTDIPGSTTIDQGVDTTSDANPASSRETLEEPSELAQNISRVLQGGAISIENAHKALDHRLADREAERDGLIQQTADYHERHQSGSQDAVSSIQASMEDSPVVDEKAASDLASLEQDIANLQNDRTLMQDIDRVLAGRTPAEALADLSHRAEQNAGELEELEASARDFDDRHTTYSFDQVEQTKSDLERPENPYPADAAKYREELNRLAYDLEIAKTLQALYPEDKDSADTTPASPEADITSPEADTTSPEADLPTLEELEKRKREKEADLEAAEAERDGLKPDNEHPLVAIDADFTVDAEMLADIESKRALDAETAQKGLLTNIWKNTLFRKYYERKYRQEMLSGDRTVVADDGKEYTIEQIIERQKDGAMQRFVLAAVESRRYLNEKIGEKRKDGTYDGETLVEADAKTTEKIKDAVSWFATAKVTEQCSLDDLKRQFSEKIGFLKASARDEKSDASPVVFDNYLEVALQAREAAEHGAAMERVLEGFKAYRAEARDGSLTEVHRDRCDKIIDWLDNHTGGVVPVQAIALGVSVASAFMTTGARAIGGVAAGIGASALLSAMKRGDQYRSDREQRLRMQAVGRTYEGDNAQNVANSEPTSRRDRRRQRYEAELGGTLYQIASANDLKNSITAAQSLDGEGAEDALLHALAEANVRYQMSNDLRLDIVAYSSADKRGTERLELMKTMFEAEDQLSDDGKAKLNAIKNQISEQILTDIKEKDQNFTDNKRKLMAKTFGKSLLMGAATFTAITEGAALIDPNTVGLLEKTGIVNTANNTDAHNTLLTEMLTGPNTHTVETVTLNGDQTVERDALKAAGYTEVETTPAGTKIDHAWQEVAPGDAADQIKYQTDAWLNNGTSHSDGLELRIFGHGDNLTAAMSGSSTLPDGTAINYDDMLAAGRIKGVMTLPNGSVFEIAPHHVDGAGHLVFGDNGIFTTTGGSTINIGGGYDKFQIVVDNGVDASGTMHGISFATEIGDGSFNGTIGQLSERIVDTPAEFTLTKTVDIPPAVTPGVFFAETPRTGLGATQAVKQPKPPETEGTTPEPEGTTPETEENTPETEGAVPNNPTPETEPATPDNSTPTPESSSPTPNNPTPEGASPTPEATESNPETPEATAPTPEETAEAETRAANAKYLQQVERRRDLIGDEGVRLLTAPAGSLENATEQLTNWYDNLSDNARSAALRLYYDNKRSKALSLGDDFRQFMLKNHDFHRFTTSY